MHIRHTTSIILTALVVMGTTMACGGNGPSAIVSITSVTPTVGPSGIATEIRIKGMGFKAGAKVTLGAPATDVSVIDSETIVAKTPAFTQGTVSVNVRNPDGGSATLPGAFQFVGALPMTVFTYSPNKAPAGWWVTIVGKGFQPGVTITFGGVPATLLVFSDVQLIVSVPLLPGGLYDLIIRNPSGEVVTLPSAFTFQAVTFSANTSAVAAGGPLSITWDAPFFSPSDFIEFDDWIGLFAVGTPSQRGAAVWWSTLFTEKGTLNLPAPMSPGQYEFRYISANTVQAAVSVVVTGGAH